MYFCSVVVQKIPPVQKYWTTSTQEFRDSFNNGALTVVLDDYIANSGIDYWIYGHSHRNIDAHIGDTQILSNQLGYVSQGEHLKNGFSAGRYIEV